MFIFIFSCRRDQQLCPEPPQASFLCGFPGEPRAPASACPCVRASRRLSGSWQAEGRLLPPAPPHLRPWRRPGRTQGDSNFFLAELQDGDKQTREPQLRERLQGRLLFHGLLVGSVGRPGGGGGEGGPRQRRREEQTVGGRRSRPRPLPPWLLPPHCPAPNS